MEHRTEPRALSSSLERQIVELCNRPSPYRVEALPVAGADAPVSLSALLDATAGDADPRTGGDTIIAYDAITGGTLRTERGDVLGVRIPVSKDNCKRTIWSQPEYNLIWRALHDSIHVAFATEFNLRGELETARRQCALIHGKPERLIAWADSAGQSLYYDRWERFPVDQRAFAVSWVRIGEERTLAREGF